MKMPRYITIWIVIILSGLFTFAFAAEIVDNADTAGPNTRIIYNGTEVKLEDKLVQTEGGCYLPVEALAELFNKSIQWNQQEQLVTISDKPDIVMEKLKAELAARDKSIADLEKELEAAKRLSLAELQALINDQCGEYEGVICKTILSGNEDEIRVKLEIDLSRDKASWNSLSINKRKDMLKGICNVIASEYANARIKGYIKDISVSKKLVTFFQSYEDEVVFGTYKNYNTVSVLEDRFNNDYDDYFNGMHLTFALNGNDERITYTVYVRKDRFKDRWDSISEGTLKNFMKKLCSEIRKEFAGCNITGSIFDTDGSKRLSVCEQYGEEAFSFSLEQ